jgi:ATP-dependent helicase/nuclease subunit A
MSERTWTKEQEAAIQTRGCSLLVSAAAGAGKTAVLVERIVRRILDEENPVDVDKVLVVTFTNAAAREMRERIGEALAKRLKEKPQDRRLQKQSLLLGKAAISTLHSFCLELLRQNYYRLSLPGGLALDPRFRIADEVEGVLLKLEVLEDFFEEKYGAEESAFLALVEGLGGERDDQALQDLVLKLYEFSRSQPDPLGWLGEAARIFQANLTDEQMQFLFRRLMKSLAIPLQEAVELLDKAQRIAAQPGGPALYLSNLETEKTGLAELMLLCERNWQAAFTALAEFKFASLKACRAEVDEALKKEVQALRNQAKELVRTLQKEYLSRSPLELVQDMQEMKPLMDCLCTLVKEFSLRYLQEKLARNLLDFNDLEHFTLALLREQTEEGWVPSALAYSLRKKYEEVLVDEYQDINAVQETVLSLVAREGTVTPNLFMVGDVKQSIYGFRLAEPRLFLKKYQSYGTEEGLAERKVLLTKNFRSSKNVVEGVNFVFRQLMGKGLGEITYDRDHELVFGAETESNWPLEVHFIERNSEEVADFQKKGQDDSGQKVKGGKFTDGEGVEERDENGSWQDEAITEAEAEELDALQAEARLIGRRILELQQEMVIWDREKKKYRAPEFRDMVVLLRSIKGTAPTLLEEFRQLGIPAYAETGSGYFAAQEVQVLLSLLKVIDNPCQEIPLAAVLLSPVVGLLPEDLARIRLCCPGDYYHALRLAARVEERSLKERLQTFLRSLRSWQTFARRNSLVELIWLLYRETGYYDYAGAMPGGKQRQANLRALLDRAKQFEDTTMKGLFKFLRFLERLEKTNSDLGTARALGEKENVVRIMSIHKSKGLEFPLVFIGCLGKMFNLQELRGDILLDKELGLGPVWVDPLQRLKYPTLAKLVVREKLKEEMLAEEIRILYVAMTRAREALIMVGSVKGLNKQVKKWSTVLSQQGWELPAVLLTRARCPWDWLGPCLLRHRESGLLRKAAGCPEQGWEVIANDPAPWRIYQVNSSNIQTDENKDGYDYQSELACVKALLPVEVACQDNEWQKFIDSRLSWSYSDQGLVNIPAKLSVTEIKNRYQFLAGEQQQSQSLFPFRQFAKRPRFLQQQGLSASEKGSALHSVMRHLNLEEAATAAMVQAQIGRMVDRQILTPLQAESIKVQEIVKLLRSPLGERIKEGKDLRREVPFTLALPAKELYPEVGGIEGEKIILQGTIDCLFMEGGAYVLVDYKTDVIAAGAENLLRERYKIQMDLYARAVNTIFRRPVKEKILYSFSLQRPVFLE